MTGLNSSQCSGITSRGAYIPTILGCSPVTDPTSPISPQLLSPGFSSAEYQPLSSIRDQTNDSPTKPNPPRKRRKDAGKPGKVMKEAYFKGIAGTKTFVTAPLDPQHNRYKFYCQICKTNVSIHSKGAREIVRNYQSESHLREDQRWRYEHLRRTDQVTGIVTKEVRGKDGQVLTLFELEKEKPLFEDAPLVDIGCKYPFFDEYMAGIGSVTNPAEIRLAMQISLVGHFVPVCGDVQLLGTLWKLVGEVSNHQEPFSPYDWGATTLTVRIVPFGSILFSLHIGVKFSSGFV